MIGLLMDYGLGKRVAQVVGYVGIPLLTLVAIWWAITVYGNSRYDAGVTDTDASWQEASNVLIDQAAAASNAADASAEDRATDYAANLTAEKEKIDEAQREGSSPLDVLFGGNGMR